MQGDPLDEGLKAARWSPTKAKAGARTMSENEPAFIRLSDGISRTGRRISQFLSVLELALQVRRERRDLAAMDERTLKDLGLNGNAYKEASRPFWDVPRERVSH